MFIKAVIVNLYGNIENCAGIKLRRRATALFPIAAYRYFLTARVIPGFFPSTRMIDRIVASTAATSSRASAASASRRCDASMRRDQYSECALLIEDGSASKSETIRRADVANWPRLWRLIIQPPLQSTADASRPGMRTPDDHGCFLPISRGHLEDRSFPANDFIIAPRERTLRVPSFLPPFSLPSPRGWMIKLRITRWRAIDRISNPRAGKSQSRGVQLAGGGGGRGGEAAISEQVRSRPANG